MVFCSALCAALCFTAQATADGNAQLKEKTDHQTMIREAIEQVNAYHAGEPQQAKTIRIVYFHAQDREPLPQWRSRLTRTLTDVEQFYQQGMEKFGLKASGLRFERDERGLVFHLVQGQQRSNQYAYDSGGKIEREIQAALKDKLDLSRDFVLALHGLCDKDDRGNYKFHAPYYGRGSQKNGFCHAADCELLDSNNLSETDRKIVYSEHYYKRKEQTLAKFNSWYIGGIAHELGHGLSLPHDAAAPPDQSNRQGISLMGSGNHHYREDLSGGKQPAYLSIGSALRLLSHPIVTRSDRGRFDQTSAKLNELLFSERDGSLRLDGSIDSNVPTYALIGYMWHTPSWPGNPMMDHRSFSFPVVLQGNSFGLDIGQHRSGDYRLRLAALHCNGASSTFDFHVVFDSRRKPNVRELNETRMTNRLVKAVSSQDPNAKEMIQNEMKQENWREETKQKLQVLHDVLTPPAPIDLASTEFKRVALSDAEWDSSKVGWGSVARNHYELEPRSRAGVFLNLKGDFHAKGLYAHSNSRFVYKLGRRWKTFRSVIGLQDGALRQGSAVFRVIGDGKLLYQSKILRSQQSAEIKLDVSNVSELKLTARGGEGHNHNSWAIWATPIVER